MTKEQYYKIFEYWKTTLASKTDLCSYSVWEGGSGYVGFDRCSIYDKVKYGGQGCEANCPNFEEASLSKLMMRFNIKCARSPKTVESLFDTIGITDYTEDDLKL